MNARHNQTGVALVMALVMLLVLSMIGVSSVRATNSSIRIVGNMQIQDEIELAAQAAIEKVVSNLANFTTPTGLTDTITISGTDYAVAITAASCLNSVDMAGNSIKTTPPKMNYFDVQATVTDPRTGATVTVQQGVRIALPVYQSC